MSAPAKHRSMKETKNAERLVDFRRKRVAIAHAKPSTETMKSTLRSELVSQTAIKNKEFFYVNNSQDVIWCKLVGFLKLMNKPCLSLRLALAPISTTLEGRTSIPIRGIKVIISVIRQNVKNIPAIIVKLYDLDRGSCADTNVAEFRQCSGSLDVATVNVGLL